MSIFSRSARPANARAGALPTKVVVEAFELLLGRPPVRDGEVAAAQRHLNLRELVDHLIRSDEFRARHEMMTQSPSSDVPATIAPARPAPIFLGDRVLCWTHRGQRIYLVPQDVDLTPRILLNGTWELQIEETMLRFVRPGDTVIDLGANIGYYTIILCVAVAPEGKVYAFEAHPDLVRLIKATMYINGLSHLVELHCCAVSDRPGTLSLALSPDHYGSGNVVPPGFIPTYDENYPNRLDVPAVTLDATLADRIPAVDLLHMDIEGSEPLALRGAQTLIERSPRIKIVTEWSVGMMAARTDVGAYVSWLQGLGFRFWVIERETAALTPVAATDLLGLPHGDLLMSRTDLG